MASSLLTLRLIVGELIAEDELVLPVLSNSADDDVDGGVRSGEHDGEDDIGGVDNEASREAKADDAASTSCC